MNQKQGFVYIITNPVNTVLYTGVTSNLRKRILEHKSHDIESFSKRYNTNKLVYYEIADSIESAIAREKQIKGGSRVDKINLIENFNPNYKDLSEEI